MQLNRSGPLNLMESSHGEAKCNSLFEAKCKDCSSDYCVVQKLYEYRKKNPVNASNETNKLIKCNNMQSNELPKEFGCNICFKRFARPGSLRAHARLHTNVAPEHICKYCSKSFRWKSNLIVHYAIHNRQKIACETCKQIVPIDKIDKHRNQHLNQLLQCKYCEKAYSNQYKLNYHVRSKHPEVNAWQCQYCTESFTYTKRQAKICNQNCDKQNIECHQCKKIFTTQQSLRDHERIHGTAIEPYECKICGQIFSLKRNLYSHIMRHVRNGNNNTLNVRLPQEKPLQKRIFVCKICKQVFHNKSDAFNCKHDTRPAAYEYDERMGNTSSTSKYTVQIGLASECNAERSGIPQFDVRKPKISNVESLKSINTDSRPVEINGQQEPVSLVQTSIRRSTFDDCIETNSSIDIAAQRIGGGCASIQFETIVIDDTDSCSDDDKNAIIDYSLPKINPK